MASKNITFDKIPASIRKPGKYFEFNTKLAVRTLPTNEQVMLIIGQRTSDGSVAQLVPTRVFSDAEAQAFFGAGSIAHLMARAAIKANPYLQLTVVALDDAAAGVQARGTLTVTGPATSAGVLTVYIGNAKVDVGIDNADTAADIAAALVAEITANPDLPVTAAAGVAPNTHVVTLTAKNDGLCGNDIGIGHEIAGGTGVAVAVVAMATGAANPDIQDALDVVFAEQYDVIATPFNVETVANPCLSVLKAHLELVSGPMEQRPAIAVYAMNGALSDATTLAGAINSGRILSAYLRYTAATRRKSMPFEIAAAYGAVLAFEEDPARPLNTLDLPGIAVADIADRLSRTEQEALLHNGVAPIEIVTETVRIVRAISTYTEDAQGVADVALLDITTIRTLDYVRKACRTRIALRFPREKLSSKTPPRVKSELLDVLLKLQDLDIVENVEENKAGLVVERDEQDPNRLNAKIPADVVNGLHVFAGRIDLLL